MLSRFQRQLFGQYLRKLSCPLRSRVSQQNQKENVSDFLHLQPIHFPLKIAWLSRTLSLRFLSAAAKHDPLCLLQQQQQQQQQQAVHISDCSWVIRCLLLLSHSQQEEEEYYLYGIFATSYVILIVSEDKAI